MAVSLAACGGSSSSSAPAATEAATEAAAAETEAAAGETAATVEGSIERSGNTYEYNVGASAPSGQSYRWVVPMCELVNQYSDFVTLNPVTTTGSVENVNLMVNGEAPLAVGPASTVYLAINGMSDWEGNPVDKDRIKFAYSYMPDYFYIALPADSDINTIEDMKGKTIGFGEAGSGTYTGTMAALNALGFQESDFNIENVSLADAAPGVTEGWIDAIPVYGSATTSAIQEMAAGSAGLKVIGVSAEQIQQAVASNPVYVERTMEKSYEGIEPLETFGGTTALWCNSDVPDEVTYEIARIINEHIDELTLSFEMGEYSAAENSVGVVNIVDMAGGTEAYLKDLGLITE